MDEVIAGSSDAFGELYDRYSARAFRIARSVCHDRGVAEDAVQEAFVSIFKNRTSYRSQRGTVAAWVLMVVLSRAIDVSRAQARHATRRASDDALAVLPAPGDVADQAGARVDAVSVRSALAALPDAQREAITLAYYGELTHTEIAERLGVPFGTVKGRIRLGMNKLRLDFDPAQSSEAALTPPDRS
ncbi:MAG: sigma-70 family RNA polymerase sigma factor [Actinomycetota bacterium]|nr:sigma-70 family RNA polymerase sigma factor [Actinomycetota bacterium]